jgi:thermitase
MIEKGRLLIERINGNLQRINPKSPVFIAAVGFALVLFLTFIFTIFNVGSRQDEKDEIATVSPTPIPAKDLTPGRDYVPGQLIVKFKEGVTQNEINQTLAKYNASVKTTITGINSTVISIPPGEEDEIRKSLSTESIVKYAELDHVAHALTNDPQFSNQYGLKNTGQSIKGQAGTNGADSKLESAWGITKGNGVKIAVLDTGIDMSHPDLASKVSAQKILITSSIDDQFGHGTHVAGIVAAVTNNSQGIAGACPDCTMIIGKVLDDSGNGPYSVIAQGITWAADSGAKVINMSLGGYSADNTLAEAAAYAWDKGSIIVAAAGNDNTTNKFYPGANANVVTVAATDNKDRKASFSNYGDWVEVTAAGVNIYSTLPTHSYVLQNKGIALNYDYLSGTSMASPLVSGVVGLLWSSSHGTSKEAVVDRLYASADQISGTGSSWTKGRVNAEAAVGGGNRAPKGVVDEYSCKVRGWAFDPDESGKSIEVHAYINGAVGTPNAEGHNLGETSVNRPDVNSAHGITGVHGFDWQIPNKYRDGKSRPAFIYAIDSKGGANPQIGEGSIKCSSSAPDPSPSVGVSPTGPVPTFVCGGSPNSICTSPSPTGSVTTTPRPSISQ